MKIVNLPRFEPLSAYHEVIASVTEKLAKKPWIKHVYQIGSVGCPGISDIDLVVITEDAGFNGTGENVRRSPDDYFFIHDALWLRSSDLDRLTDLFCTNAIYHPIVSPEARVAGTYCLSEEQRIIYLLEICFNKLVQQCSSSSRKIAARKLLTRASSIVHSIGLAKQLDIAGIEQAETFGRKMTLLRDEWIATEGEITIDYAEMQRELTSSLLVLLNECLEQKAALFDAPSLTSVSLLVNRLVGSVSKGLASAGSGESLKYGELLARYFSGYEANPSNALQLIQKQRKSAIESHYSYLKQTGLTYSLRSVPAVPFALSRRIRRAIFDPVKFHIHRKYK